MPQKKPLPPSYVQRLIEELDAWESDYVAVLNDSEIQYVNPNGPYDSVYTVGAADRGWRPSSPALEVRRMELLRRLRDWAPRFCLLFPHPTRDDGEARRRPGAPGALAGS
ncbi:hypothetical protein ABZ840_00015 [Streptomyces sp. NPDC047117]|uniref:hypothetical protein n=1 Tax=Streptomyces sp. NPDC047117 TaxID=3155379 RepID=UPI003410CA76